MAFINAQTADRNTDLIPVAAALFLAGLFSAVHITAFGASWSLIWLPFLIVAIWPRRTALLPSAVLLFGAGLWIDWTTLGALGQWPLVFLLTYFGTAPARQSTDRGILSAVRRFGYALLIGIPVFILTGWAVYGAWPDWLALARGLLLLALILPIAALIRDALARNMSRER